MIQVSIKENPFYTTQYGAAYLGDALTFLRQMERESVDLIVTSPPFALKRKKEYGNVDAKDYVPWFVNFAGEFKRILKDSGSLVVDIGGTWVKGQPTRSLYHFELVIALCKEVGFHLAQEFYWYNPSKLPSPAEWVTVRRIRVKDAVDPVWWLSKTAYPQASNWRVLKPYSDSMKKLLEHGYKAKRRPSGHDISENFSKEHKGAIPPNLLSLANTDSNSIYLRECRRRGIKPHPARFPHGLPEFFIKFLTEPGDLVIDPFAGSNVTGEMAERLARHWFAFELVEEYLETSKFRFPSLCQHLHLSEIHKETVTIEGFHEDTEVNEADFQLALFESQAGYLAPAAVEAPAPPEPDDLKRIEGIGPKFSSVLQEGGIATFAQLAEAEVSQIEEILEAADPRLRRLADPTTWPEQAALAAGGEWEALAALQGQLKRGRRV